MFLCLANLPHPNARCPPGTSDARAGGRLAAAGWRRVVGGGSSLDPDLRAFHVACRHGWADVLAALLAAKVPRVLGASNQPFLWGARRLRAGHCLAAVAGKPLFG